MGNLSQPLHVHLERLDVRGQFLDAVGLVAVRPQRQVPKIWQGGEGRGVLGDVAIEHQVPQLRQQLQSSQVGGFHLRAIQFQMGEARQRTWRHTSFG